VSAGPPLGVGILGAGPVTQAIHLPTLARLTDMFRVVSIMDVDADVARSVAARVDARDTTDMSAVLDDADVDVVVVCSPHHIHAEQVIAACRAGKKAVLCEKPFATTTEQAEAIAAVSAETGVPILVGAMHTFDPGWLAAKAHWGELPERARFIRSSIVLPPNPRYEDFATEVITRPSFPPPDYGNPDVVAGMVRGGVLGLAIHDLPLVRAFLPHYDDIDLLSAEVERPGGYSILLRSGDRLAEVHAVTSKNWAPNWAFHVFSDEQLLDIEFTPSYVQAGGAVAQLTTAERKTTFGPADYNGYEGEWRELAEVARGAEPETQSADLIADLTFALNIADLAAEKAGDTVRRSAA